MKVLITGADGFIGKYLVGELQKNHSIYALVKKGQGIEEYGNCIKIEMDLKHFPPDGGLPEKLDSIIHLAQSNIPFQSDRSQVINVNILSTQKLLEYGKRAGITKFIYASSGSIYGLGDKSFGEHDPVVCPDFYSFTKYASELLVQQYGSCFPTVILRLFTPYGPGQKGRLIHELISRIESGQKVTVYNEGNPRLNPIYITDVLEVVKRCLQLTGNHILNVGGKDTYSILEISRIIGQIYQKTVKYEYLIDKNRKDLTGDISRLINTLGYTPQIDLRAGILRLREIEKNIQLLEH